MHLFSIFIKIYIDTRLTAKNLIAYEQNLFTVHFMSGNIYISGIILNEQ